MSSLGLLLLSVEDSVYDAAPVDPSGICCSLLGLGPYAPPVFSAMLSGSLGGRDGKEIGQLPAKGESL